MRLDIRLTELGFAESRNKAKNMIEEGFVSVNGVVITKPSADVHEESEIEIADGTLAYVGRGGLKLEAALDAFQIHVNGLRAVDVGASTGGFTDCMLKRGVACVYAIDSGRAQLHPKLAADHRVRVHEGFNARNLTRELTEGAVDLVVCDVSFISQTLLHSAISSVLQEDGILISLIKPQFEAGRAYLNKNGIIRDKRVMFHTVEAVIDSARQNGLYVRDVILSPIKGGDGNREFLAYFTKMPPDDELSCSKVIESLRWKVNF